MRFLVLLAPMAATGVVALALAGAPIETAHAQAPAVASPARGKILFLRCSSCHAVAANAPAKIGPNLSGVVGRKGGSVPGYRYSAAMKAKAPVWNDANLDAWLTAPAKLVPGTSMAFAGLSNPADRKALIAYLKTPR